MTKTAAPRSPRRRWRRRGRAVDAPSFIKHDDDMKLIDGLDPRWSGALPATFLFDAGGPRTSLVAARR